ncbi:unnamed protein product [Phaedon cochleariae]|uniref:Uncharacterized protein n=1 Tax=Phaedon cochleariae TaxID=80249 RepID=A0A9N9SKZ7_PHACE|nr:unnamed protein product [Phaedon cochleariae]
MIHSIFVIVDQKSINYVHASNPSLCRSSNFGAPSGFVGRKGVGQNQHRARPDQQRAGHDNQRAGHDHQRACQPENLAGFVTLEELMIRQTEERKLHPHHIVEEVERNMLLARPDVVYGECEKSDGGSSCFGKRLGSLKKHHHKQEDFDGRTATYPKASKAGDQKSNRSLPRTHKMQEAYYAVNDVQFATNRTLDDKMYQDTPKKAAKIKKQHSFSSGDKKSKFTSKVHDSGSSKVKLKSATQYTPMLLPTNQDPKSRPKFAFELNLDEKTQKGGKLKQMFGGGGRSEGGKKEKTFLGSPKLHRAIFQKHGSGSDLSWPSSGSSFSQASFF